MGPLEYILISLAAAIVALVGVILIRTLRFKPKALPAPENSAVEVDGEKFINELSELVKCRTVSYYDRNMEDEAEFEKLLKLLPKFYPYVYEKCTLLELPDRALLYKYEGKNHDAPAVLMAHYDVVPVIAQSWEKPPFDGIIEDGVLWGRGTLDTKITFAGALYALNKMIGEGFVPENDIYLAFSGGEEVNGKGAVNIVDYFEKNGITPAMVVDEGGAVVENVFPGVKLPCALIGIAEKGMIDLEYRVKSPGGHSSAPKPNSPLVQLSRACLDIEKKPFKRHLTKPVAGMFDTLGRHSSFLYRMIFANLWAFGGLLDMICKSGGGELNAMMRTTVAFTQAKGSSTPNVIPPEASMVSNMRLNPMDTVDSAVEYLKGVIDNENVVLNKLRGMNPSRISDTEADGYKRVEKAILGTWKNSIVSPYLMVQCSDSRHWGRISDKVYRFSAMDLTSEERATIHGNNERIRIDCAKRAAEFYIRLIKQC